MTQAEVIYIDEVNRLCCPDQATAAAEEQPQQPAPEGEGESSVAAAAAAAAAVMGCSGFFDPLLHRPPEVVAADKKAQERLEAGMLNRPWIAGEGVMILVPLRLGLASLNADYIPGAFVFLKRKNAACVAVPYEREKNRVSSQC